MPINFDNIKNNIDLENILEVCVREFDDPDNKIKISNEIDKFKIHENFIRFWYNTQPLYRITRFAKDSVRQNIYEKNVFSYIEKYIINLQNILNIKIQIKKLSNNGGLMIVGGNILPYSKKYNSRCKTIDFEIDIIIKNNIYKRYISHKYTKEVSGGSQDNQYIDIKNYIQECNLSMDNNLKFYAIVDGEYYKNNNRLKMNELKNICTQKVVVCDTNDFIDGSILINDIKNIIENMK